MSGTRGLQTKNAPDSVKSGTLHLNILPPEFARTEGTCIIQGYGMARTCYYPADNRPMLRQPDCISQVFQLVLLDEHCDRPFFYSLTPHLSPASEPR